jgi:predicted CoA-binding protein
VRPFFEELRKRGYEMVPVNPKGSEVMDQPCYARVQDIQPPVDGALLMTKPEITEEVVGDCAAAGIRRVWMYRAGGKGAVSLKAVASRQEHGIQVIAGQCPFMFLTGAAGVHKFHGFVRRLPAAIPNTSTLLDFLGNVNPEGAPPLSRFTRQGGDFDFQGTSRPSSLSPLPPDP